jgi:hypothetical protein
MKAILEFDLPDEQYEFERAVEGRRWQWFAHSLMEYIKKEKKWNDKLTDGEYKVLEKVEQEFYDLLEEEGLSLDIE